MHRHGSGAGHRKRNRPPAGVSTPKDIEGLAAFLASSDSDYISGQIINVDGGMVLH